ncbi:hypothetical protein JZU69_06480 [bacterium]|nr:hypothetical protein [bacterium]
MGTDIQNKLNELSSQCDHRISVFEVEITGLKHKTLTLSGRVLDQTQVDDLHRLFPHLRLDTASINILNRPSLPVLRVATNITGLYEKPTFGMPLSSELYFGTKMDIWAGHINLIFQRAHTKAPLTLSLRQLLKCALNQTQTVKC